LAGPGPVGDEEELTASLKAISLLEIVLLCGQQLALIHHIPIWY
jgi:hypothetical protein